MTTAMVTSPHALASIEGQRVLKAGGNAIEAVIAMGAVLAVVYPHFCGLGGDAVWLVADRTGEKHCLLGIGQAVEAVQGYEQGVPLRGPRAAATTACLVDSWDRALRWAQDNWGGTQSFAGLLARAAELAESGFPLSHSQRFWLDYRADEWPGWPGFAALFDTQAQPEGAIFRQAELARTLNRLMEEGPRSFYECGLAQDIANGLQAAGSPITVADLAATRSRMVAPLALPFAGHELIAPPSPTQGVSTLMIMGILERLGIADVPQGSVEFYHLLVEAIKQAFLHRSEIGDPDFAPQPVDRWLDPEFLQGLAANIDRRKAMPWGATFKTGDTVYLAAVDADGRCASVLQSTYFDWGSGVVAGDTGVLWQNRAAAFTSGVNALRPGARPFYTLNPGIALKDGRPRILYGTQGADGQPQTLATLLTRVICHGMTPEAALAAPRFLLGKTFSDSRDTLKLEADAGAATFAALRDLGHELAELPPASPISGQAGLIIIDAENTHGAHDPRSDGIALTVE